MLRLIMVWREHGPVEYINTLRLRHAMSAADDYAVMPSALIFIERAAS